MQYTMKRAYVCWTVAAMAVVAGCGIVAAETGSENGLPIAKVEAQVGLVAGALAGADSSGNVYTMTNATDGNEVIVYERNPLGEISEVGRFPTGGFGTGAGLGNQSGLVLSEDGRWLFVVNAGSDELSVFRVALYSLVLTDIVPSGGAMPISVTAHGPYAYVLNAGGVASITGFMRAGDGKVDALVGSTRPLSADAPGPAQVSFSPDGALLVVTEKATNLITTYVVGDDGLAGSPQPQASHGATPFGFGFSRTGWLIVSEAFGGAADASAVSSYAVDASGVLAVVSGSVPTTETAACWIVVTGNNQFAYTTNTGSGTISGYRLQPDSGVLTLLDPDGVTADTGAGSAPIDLALSRDSRYLYALNSATHEIAVFQVDLAQGDLAPVQVVAGLPVGTNGLAAR